MSNAPQQGWQQPAQGGYPQQPGYQLNSSSYPAPGYLAAPQRKRGAGAALTSVILAVVAIIASPIITVAIQAALIRDMDVATYGLLNMFVHGGVLGVLSIVGLILGIVAARGDAKVLSGVGIGANAWVLLGLLTSAAIGPLMQLLY